MLNIRKSAVLGFPLFFDNFLGDLGEFERILNFLRLFLSIKHENKKKIYDILGHSSWN